jgi:hypothetical protein
MNCTETLQPIFDHIRKTAIDQKAIPLGGNRYQENQVFATVTIHQAGDHKVGGKADFVLYGNGQLNLAQETGKEFLSGGIQAWINDVKVREVKQSWIFDRFVIDRDIFPNTPQLGIKLTVDAAGMVSLGITVEGKLWENQAPVTFQANSARELLMAVIDDGFMGSKGPSSITIGFTLSSNDKIDPAK